jgi:hypothetical protein
MDAKGVFCEDLFISYVINNFHFMALNEKGNGKKGRKKNQLIDKGLRRIKAGMLL